MKTLRLKVDSRDLQSHRSQNAISQAAEILRRGGLVAFPTETVYGLGANALSEPAVEKIFVAKQRPHWDPLIVHIANLTMLSSVVADDQLTPCARSLMAAFWPGPLTLLLPKGNAIPGIVTSRRPLVGIRIPAHPVAEALLRAAGLPIAAPSANSFGHVSPTLADHVLDDLNGRIDAVLDSGDTTHGLESTVVDVSGDEAIVYRPGIVSLEQIRDVCGSARPWEQADNSQPGKGRHANSEGNAIGLEGAIAESMPAPGVGIRHYAPKARLILVDCQAEKDAEDQAARFTKAVEGAIADQPEANPRPIGLMLPENFLSQPMPEMHRIIICRWGDWKDPGQLAHGLFAGLRYLDSAGVGSILCPVPPGEGICTAIRDRLLKAAKPR